MVRILIKTPGQGRYNPYADPDGDYQAVRSDREGNDGTVASSEKSLLMV